MASMMPQDAGGPCARIWRTLPNRRPKWASNSRRPLSIRVFISYFGNRHGIQEPSPRILLIFRAAANPICRQRRSVELAEEDGFSATFPREDFTENLRCLPTAPESWAGRNVPVSMDDTKMRQCKLGGLCWVAIVSPPDICASFAGIACRINSFFGSHVYGINHPARAAKEWQMVTALQHASPSHPSTRMTCVTRGRNGWSDAASWTDVIGWMAGRSLRRPVD